MNSSDLVDAVGSDLRHALRGLLPRTNRQALGVQPMRGRWFTEQEPFGPAAAGHLDL